VHDCRVVRQIGSGVWGEGRKISLNFKVKIQLGFMHFIAIKTTILMARKPGRGGLNRPTGGRCKTRGS